MAWLLCGSWTETAARDARTARGHPLTLHGFLSGTFLGCRFPGVWLRQRLTPARADTRVALQFAVLRGSWSDEPALDPVVDAVEERSGNRLLFSVPFDF